MVRWNYELVQNFISENSECELLSTEFITAKTKMEFKCTCGKLFETSFEKFRLRNKRQCIDCGRKIMKSKQSLDIDVVREYVESNSKCKLLSDIYINTKAHLQFECHCGLTFSKSFEKFKSKEKQCKECSYKDISNNQTFNFDFVKDYIESFGCELLDDYYIDCAEKLNLKCICGEHFNPTFTGFKNSYQIRCRKCTNQMSKGEIIIEDFLKKNELKYDKQYTFEDLKAINNKHFLKFDFAILNELCDVVCLIEFDGMQHFKPVDFYGGEIAFKNLQLNDSMKNNYCENNNINLIRIPYKEINHIENVLADILLPMITPCQAS